MDDLPSLSLNLSNEGPGAFAKKKNKVSSDRKERIQQRREEKNSRPKFQDGRPSSVPQGGFKRKADPDDQENVKRKKGEGIISSLFKKNPDVPEILSENVTPLLEQVFTGKTFKDLPIHPFLISNLEEKQGYSQMTEIQRRAIPVLLQGKDTLVQSQTGSGKTVTYAVPVVQSLASRKLKVDRSDGPYALVIVPTRELAIQSYETFAKLLKAFIWIVPGCLMGGEKKKAEKSRLRKGVNVLVATPGRLLDHLKTTQGLSLRRLRWLVFDEADRLLELGYERDVAAILTLLKTQCPDPPQTVMLSATLSEGVERLSSISLNDPTRVSASDDLDPSPADPGKPSNTDTTTTIVSTEKTETAWAVPSGLKQEVLVCPAKLRLVALAAVVLGQCKFGKEGKVLVFLSTQDSVEFHSKLFSEVLNPKDKRSTTEKLQALAEGSSLEDLEAVPDSDEEGEGDKDPGQRQRLNIQQLHGDMSQKERSKTFQEFAQATSGVLLCTDVAARGLDLPHVTSIVQFTPPTSTVDYIHRVGRTARAGTKGHSLLFLMPHEAGFTQELAKSQISLSPTQPGALFKLLLTNLDKLPQADADSKRQRPVTKEEAATHLMDRFEEAVVNDATLRGLAGRGFQSYIRAYGAYSKSLKAYFAVSSLHLGHMAKSFALREAPGKVAGVAVRREKKSYKQPQTNKKRPLSFKQATLSEYSSGVQKGKMAVQQKKHKMNSKKKMKK